MSERLHRYRIQDGCRLSITERNPPKAVFKESISPFLPLKIIIKLMETGISTKTNERLKNVTVLVQANGNDISNTSSFREECLNILSL